MSVSPIRVLELRSVVAAGGGPEKTILLGAKLADPRRVAVTVCYLRSAGDRTCNIRERAATLGLDYVELVERGAVDYRVWSDLRTLVRERGIEIVHAHDYKTDLLARLLAASEGIIPLATAHGWTGNSRRERFLYYPADKRLLRAFPMMIAVSDEIRRELVRAGVSGDRVRVILNGIDHRVCRRDRRREADARRDFGFRATDLVVGAVGRVEHQKRFDLLIRACAELRPRWPNLRLVIAGDGSLRTSLSELAGRLLPARSWQFLGHHDQISTVHHAIDLFVQSSDYEGTPNSVLEAMAFESPIVATAAGGTAELVADGVEALVVPCGDLAGLCAAIDGALTDREAMAARVRAARRAVETRLSFETRMAAVEAIYGELASRRRLAMKAA